jgi:hypothetical protein
MKKDIKFHKIHIISVKRLKIKLDFAYAKQSLLGRKVCKNYLITLVGSILTILNLFL